MLLANMLSVLSVTVRQFALVYFYTSEETQPNLMLRTKTETFLFCFAILFCAFVTYFIKYCVTVLPL